MRPHYASSIASIPPPKQQQYFEGNRKGEVNELKILVKNTLSEKDDKKKREVVKKVIAYMTLGIDVSKIFPEMCMASYTNDMVQKKMIYLYLTTYAEQNKDLAFMAISTFQKDCKHSDPKIRGFALRNLCSLRFSGAIEYLMPAIRESLSDIDPYVRKTAIMGCVKVYYMQPEFLSNIEEQLYKMISDNDPLVIINAIHALNEILAAEGGMALSKKLVDYLLGRLKEFNEWGQATILDELSKYQPKDDKEMFNIMNLLEERLKHSCSAIVLAVIKVFMNFTKNKPQVYEQVITRVKAPLVTLASISEGNLEIMYTILCHIKFIASKGYNQVFSQDYKCFYCRVDEPTYIKLIKLEILALIACDFNLGDMLNELGEYVTDVDQEISKKSIQALGAIALRLPDLANAIVKQLSSFITLQDYITNEVIIVFKDILRKDPKHIKDCLEIIQSDSVTDQNSKIALIYILGQFGSQIPLAPYILQTFIGVAESVELKHTLLTSCLKVFFCRAPEMQEILGQLFYSIMNNENEDIDLKDRAAFYYRALQNNPNEIKKLWQNGIKVDKFLEEQNINKEALLFEFNSLSVIYEKSVNKFIKPAEYFNNLRNKELQDQIQEQQQSTTAEKPDPVQDGFDIEHDITVSNVPIVQNQPNLLEISEQPKQKLIIDNFVLDYRIEVEYFESMWTSLNNGASITRTLARNDIANENAMEQLFNRYRLYNIAAGEEDNVLQMYFYGAHKCQVFFEFEINRNLNTVLLNTKSELEDYAYLAQKYVEDFLKQSNLIV
ncbi:unnamed protein product [Paramecium primaurelia]|uniref:AP complex subunit beta n=1 Tax=Paramecium primaurelia TaxID=5886 RepID=A0A8S1NE64_PARPR|nr:unnamed protein product [Paramecium primaurelia]